MYQVNDQAALGFVIKQGYNLEAEIYKRRYPEYNYAEVVPVVTEGNPWAFGTQFRVSDHTGKAKFLSGKATDVPFVKGTTSRLAHEYAMIGAGWEWSDEEVAQAQMMGINLANDDSMAADSAVERLLYDIAMTGSDEKNWDGFVNYTGVPRADAANTGVGPSTFWSAKTVDQILTDINTGLNSIWTTTSYVEMANTIALPPTAWSDISTRRMGTGDGTLTVRGYLETNNLYTARTNQRLTILPVRELETASQDGGGRMVVYRRDRDVLRFHLPMPKQVSQPYRSSIYGYQQAVRARTGGTEIRLPKAMTYIDEITAPPA